MSKYLCYLLGFFVCHNIVWVTRGNSSSYLFVESLISFLLILTNTGKMKGTFSYFNNYFKLYVLITLIIGIPFGLIAFMGTDFSISPLKGAVMFIISLSLLYSILLMRDNIHYLIKGFCYGFYFNLLYSLLCYFFYNMGITWRIIDYFAGDEWGFTSYTDLYYRAQGLFMECSYYMVFLATSFPLVLYYTKNKYVKLFMILIALFLSAISFTGNFVLILLSIGLYIVLIDKQLFSATSILKLGIPFVIVLFLFSDRLLYFLNDIDFFELLNLAIEDYNVNDNDNVSNVTRMNGIVHSLELVGHYPLGVGSGMSSPLLEISFSRDYGDQSTFSFLLKVLLESGWIGFMLYLAAFLSLSKRLYLGNDFQRALFICLLCSFLGQAINGIGWFSFILFVWGICMIMSSSRFYNFRENIC